MISRGLIEPALQTNDSRRRFYQALYDEIESLNGRVGKSPVRYQDNSGAAQPIPAPGTPSISVTGNDGVFRVTVTLAQSVPPPTVQVLQTRALQGLYNPVVAATYIQLQSATNLLFDAVGGVTTYGPSQQLQWQIADPGVTKYWRVRASFDLNTWSQWQVYNSAASCGAVGIASGLLRSSSANFNVSFNSTNSASVDSIDAGASATIRIYGTGGVGSSWVNTIGATTATYPAGTITGLAYTTRYAVAYDTANQIFRAYTSLTPVLPDTFVLCGSPTTVAAGGGGGSPSGGGFFPYSAHGGTA